MSTEIGRKMFKGAAIGAGVGAVGGGIYGGIKASHEIENLPVDKVTLGAYDRPVYETRQVGQDSYIKFTEGYATNDKVTAQFPVKNSDGSFKMEHIPERTVTGHGKAVVSEVQRNITEPVVSTSTNIDPNTMSASNYTNVSYNTVGHWTEPVVKFETGVSTFGNIVGYAALGAVAGGVGGALVSLALDKAGV